MCRQYLLVLQGTSLTCTQYVEMFKCSKYVHFNAVSTHALYIIQNEYNTMPNVILYIIMRNSTYIGTRRCD